MKFFRYACLSLTLLMLAACGQEGAPAALETLNQGQAGTTLSAEKTATGFYEERREYDWTLAKVAGLTSLTLGQGQSASVTYTLTATREEPTVTQVAGVRGEICVTNGGDRATEGLKLVDQVEFKTGSGQFQPLAGATQTIVPEQQLAPGETKCYPYEIEFTPVPGAQYRNTVKVTITNHSGQLGTEFGPEPKADFSLPSAPTVTEIDENASLADVLTCPEGFTCTRTTSDSSWMLTGTRTITYTVTVRNVSAECGKDDYKLENTATLTESDTEQTSTASATVTINTGECPPPPPVFQGCTPGYYKQSQHFSSWIGFTPSQKIFPFFTGSLYGNSTLLQALNFRGGTTLAGAQEILLRAAVAAVLNAANTNVNYPLTVSEIQNQVNAALASGSRSTILELAARLDEFNNAGCPL